MYYIYGISGPSLLIESTDSMIIIIIMIILFPADSTNINEGSSLPLDTGETILNYYVLHLIVIKGRVITTSEGSKFMPF